MQKSELGCPVWGKGKSNVKNCTLAFVYDIGENRLGTYYLSVAAGDIYRLFVNGELTGYGPARAAHGCARVDSYNIEVGAEKMRITVEVVSYQVNSYYLTLEPPFFDAELKIGGETVAVSCDFTCYELCDRVQRVQRYSFQRPFIESLKFPERGELYTGKAVSYPIIEIEPAKQRKYLERNVAYPSLDEVLPSAVIEKGSVKYNPEGAVWKDRSLDAIGETLLGYPHSELEEMISDTVCRFEYIKDCDGSDFYRLYEFPSLRTGLPELWVSVKSECEIYLVFEEILWDEDGAASPDLQKNLCFWRGECANIIKYRLKSGKYRLTSFEIYTLKFLKVIAVGGEAEIKKVGIITVENNSVGFSCRVSDKKVQAIIDAAVSTYSQNSVDILMDCPGRERAGWTNDSYFSSESDRLFTGTRTVERNFIENVIAAPDLEHIPAGVLPMCYPCDHFDGVFSPTCSMWFAIEVCKYCSDALGGKMPEHYKKRLLRLLDYLETFLNEDGLLEDLKGWVFIEWSRANDPDLVCGVNYPANMLYGKLTDELGILLNDSEMRRKAEKIRAEIRRQSFNGSFFEDNRIRRGGKLVRTGNVTETCQYFAFFLGAADRNEYSELFNNLVENYAYSDGEKDRTRSNIIVGLILRETLLLEAGLTERVILECKDILYKMALRTGTLWENVDIRASCNHNIASYFGVLLVKAVTGYRGVKGGRIMLEKPSSGTDGSFCFERDGVPIRLTVKNGKTTVESSLPAEYL